MSGNTLASDGVLDYLGGIKRAETASAKPRAGPAARLGQNDHGIKKRNTMSSPDKKDRIINLEKENNTLKEKENLL